MPTFDVLGRLIINDGSTINSTALTEYLDQTMTEYTEKTYLIPAPSTDLAIDLGGVASATIFYLENASTTTLSFKINGVGNDAQALTSGFVLSKGLTVSALHVTLGGTTVVPIKVVVIS